MGILLHFNAKLIYSEVMPKTKRKTARATKTAKAVKRTRVVKTSKKVSKYDNRLVIAALVLLLAVAVFMLVETWTGIW